MAVAGLIVAGLSLYLGWSDRREDKAEHDAEQAESRRVEAAQRSRIGLVATDADGDVLGFKGVACALQSADISFPAALGVPAQNTALSSRIEADWFDEPLLKALEPAKAEQGRLPVLIESRCTAEDGERLERAIYEIPFRIDSSLLRGKTVRLRGLVLREYVGPNEGEARLDAAWKALAPAPPDKS
ncbi:MAG TPA: hypothetical protein VFS49_02960 [Croceibacterium sp.]|nr:hypothetical protein [Croceibacterium sp.]